MKKALITGGAGFIGSHLAEVLLQRGHEVRIVDDFSTGSVDNILHLGSHPNFDCLNGTILDRDLMADLVDWADVIFHLASIVGVRLLIERPIQSIETIVDGTAIILGLAAEKGKKILVTSTSEVYGNLDKERFSEDDPSLLGPTSKSRWCYAASKMIDEFLALGYHRERALPVVIVRLFNTIGPRQTGHYGMVVPRFVTQALSGAPITVYGDGTQRRSFTWVGDVVDVLVDLVDNPGAYGEVFNVGHTKDISIYDLACIVKELTVSSSDITLVPYDQVYGQGFDDMLRRLPEISKIGRLVGYRPTLDLPEMLQRIIEYHGQRSGTQVVG